MNEGYSYDPASYKIIKLVNGEDIICTIEEENKNVLWSTQLGFTGW